MKQTNETMLGKGLQALSEIIEFLDINGYGKGSKAVTDARKTRDDIQAWLQRRKFTVVKCCHNCSHLNDELICCCPGAPQYKALIDDPCGDGCTDGFELSAAIAEEDIIRTAPENDDYYEADFPEWALCALVNDDPIENKDDEMTYCLWLDWMISEGYDTKSPEVTEDRNEFCVIPEFGLATSTVKVRFRKRKETMNQ